MDYHWGMPRVAVQRTFDVDVASDEAWTRLAKLEEWPQWAPHIIAVEVSPPGPLGPSSTGALRIRRLGRNSFRMSAWDPPDRWEWTGGLPGVRIVYDHQFERTDDDTTTMTWVVALDGPLASLIRPIFSRVYGRNLDRAIPSLQTWICDARHEP